MIKYQCHSCLLNGTKHDYWCTSCVTRHPTFQSTSDEVYEWPVDWTRWSAELATAVTGPHSPRFPWKPRLGRSVHVLPGGGGGVCVCKGGHQVFLSIAYVVCITSVIISFVLTGPLYMLNTYHIIPIITRITTSYVFATSVCIHNSSSSRFIYSQCYGPLHLLNSYLTSRDLSYFRGAVPRFRRDFQLVCLYGELNNEGWVDSSHCPYMQV
jgi:hypothetical protein